MNYKYLKIIFGLFFLSLFTVSCESDAEKYTTGELDPLGQGISFVTEAYLTDLEIDPAAEQKITLQLTRVVKGEAGSISIKVLQNDENVFNVPESANFAADQEEVTVVIPANPKGEGIPYTLTIALEGENVSAYSGGYTEVSFLYTVVKWEKGLGKYYSPMFGGVFEITVERNSLSPSNFRTPDLFSKTIFFSIDEEKGSATILAQPIGQDVFGAGTESWIQGLKGIYADGVCYFGGNVFDNAFFTDETLKRGATMADERIILPETYE